MVRALYIRTVAIPCGSATAWPKHTVMRKRIGSSAVKTIRMMIARMPSALRMQTVVLKMRTRPSEQSSEE